PMLGLLRDAETNGQPSPNADGDGADEDGVAFSNLYYRATAATATVTVSNAAAGGAKLDAWVDLNGNNIFDPAEEIATDVTVFNGPNLINFAIPGTNIFVGSTYARFRLSTAGGLAPTGLATDGEVEDYKITIAPTPVSAAPLVNGDYMPVSRGSTS